jgi:hypothetical protein
MAGLRPHPSNFSSPFYHQLMNTRGVKWDNLFNERVNMNNEYKVFTKNGILLLCILIASLQFITGCYDFGKKSSVLIVHVKSSDTKKSDSETDSLTFTKEAVIKALESGGQISITSDDLNRDFPEWQQYGVMSTDKRHFVQGTIVNYICSRGWKFHSINWGSLVFVRDSWF